MTGASDNSFDMTGPLNPFADDAYVESILDGSVVSDDPGLAAVVAALGAVRNEAAPVPSHPLLHLFGQQRQSAAVRRRWRVARVVGALAALSMTATGIAAAAGELPAPVQKVYDQVATQLHLPGAHAPAPTPTPADTPTRTQPSAGSGDGGDNTGTGGQTTGNDGSATNGSTGSGSDQNAGAGTGSADASQTGGAGTGSSDPDQRPGQASSPGGSANGGGGVTEG